MLKTASVIYRAGYGGMFWRLCLALSAETVPLLPKSAAAVDYHLEPRQRFGLYNMRDPADWMQLHQGSLQDPMLDIDKALCEKFHWILFSNHPSDGQGLQDRLAWLDKMFVLVLDHDRHQSWLDANLAHWGPGYPSGKIMPDEISVEHRLLTDRRTMIIDMSSVISSAAGFMEHYLGACGWLDISPQPGLAQDLWAQWHAVRVQPFLTQ